MEKHALDMAAIRSASLANFTALEKRKSIQEDGDPLGSSSAPKDLTGSIRTEGIAPKGAVLQDAYGNKITPEVSTPAIGSGTAPQDTPLLSEDALLEASGNEQPCLT